MKSKEEIKKYPSKGSVGQQVGIDFLRTLFDNNSDCYTIYKKFDDSDVEAPAITKGKFIELVSSLTSPATVSGNELTIEDYKESFEDHKRLVREIDVMINGENAAKQASLCDIVAQLSKMNFTPPVSGKDVEDAAIEKYPVILVSNGVEDVDANRYERKAFIEGSKFLSTPPTVSGDAVEFAEWLGANYDFNEFNNRWGKYWEEDGTDEFDEMPTAELYTLFLQSKKINKMTVKELKEALTQYPDHMDVFVAERKTEFAYGLVNSVRTEEITFAENPDFSEDEEVRAKDTVIVIDEE